MLINIIEKGIFKTIRNNISYEDAKDYLTLIGTEYVKKKVKSTLVWNKGVLIGLNVNNEILYKLEDR